MKILLLFVDMLRPNLLNVFNKQMPESSLDSLLYNWGGTFYTNCFTPAPDTPRSNGCAWSSRYPKDNGCDNRLKYPAYFYHEDIKDIFSILGENGYTFNVFMRPSSKEIGGLPITLREDTCYSNGQMLEEYLRNTNVEDNTLTYFCLEDFHAVITNYYAQKKGLKKGYDLISGALELIDQYIGIDTFDYTIMFSDHGFKAWEEYYGLNYYKQLASDRTQIFMLVRKKGDKCVHYNDKLCSILDIYPTLCEIAEININGLEIEGHSLLKKDEPQYIIIEDHKDFTANLGQTIELWGVRSKKGFACVNADLEWIADYEMTDLEKDEYVEILSQKASCFAENVRMRKIQHHYVECCEEYNTYYDGSKKDNVPPLKIIISETRKKVWTKFTHVIHLIRA